MWQVLLVPITMLQKLMKPLDLCRWKDMKMRIIIGVGIAILIVIIVVPIVKAVHK